MSIASLENSSFDSDTTRLLGAAFETAWGRVKASGSTFADDANTHAVRELMARAGERDHNRLVEGALHQLARSTAAEIAHAAKAGLPARQKTG